MTKTKSLLRSIVFCAVFLVAAPGLLRAADGQTSDDIAHFLAGMPPSANSSLASIANEAGWKKYADLFNSDWKSLEAAQVDRVKTWSAANIKQSQPVLYYMFSGPDYLYANAFFPNAKTIVMSGLELTGPIPELSDVTSRTAISELNGIRRALGNVFKHGYFITSEMGAHLSRPKLSGTLPIIYVFLARSGKTIQEVSLVALDKDGKVHPQDEAGFEPTAKGARSFSREATESSGRFTTSRPIFRTKVCRTAAFLSSAKTFGPGDGLVKSASYLMHNPGFSNVRDFVLKNTVTLVQDDTGIPVRFLNASDWKLHPFGVYLPPIRQFRYAIQPKLLELYKKNNEGPLNFNVGYHWGKPSNLMIAVKSAPPAK